jgi:hypothetical protein
VSKKLLICVLVVAAMLMVLPTLASATVYCVDDTPGVLGNNDEIDPSCESAVATVAAALTEAGAHAGADTVLLGPGELALPSAPGANEASYSTGEAANVVIVRGTKTTHLTMGGTAGVQTGFSIDAPAGSRLEGFAVTIPANVDGSGDAAFRLNGQVVGRDLRVEGPAAQNARGLILGAGTALEGSTVLLPVSAAQEDAAVAAFSAGSSTIADSHLEGAFGVQAGGGAVTVERSVIAAGLGLTADSGDLTVRDSVIDLGTLVNSIGVNLANYNAGNTAIMGDLDGDTIVGGGLGSVGVRVMADNGQEGAATTIASTVIEGPAKAIQVLADNGRAAAATVSYSNYDAARVELNENLDGAGAAGQVTFTAAQVAHADPGFVDAANGDFHLAPGSALIDAGDPAAPASGALDIEGQTRASTSVCPLAAGRRDIGADELVPTCAPAGETPPPSDSGAGTADSSGTGASPGTTAPVTAPAPPRTPPATSIAGKHRVVTNKARAAVTVKLSSSTPGASFRCSVDGGSYRACPAVLKLHLKVGRHTVRAIAASAAGPDPTPARFAVKVVS